MKQNERYTIDMVNGPLAPKIIKFTLPLMAASIIQLLFNAADVVVVGKFAGDVSQAAVSSTGSLINLFINLFLGLGVGVNVVVARALGSGDRSRIGAVVHTSVVVGAIGGAILSIVGELFAPVLLRLMGSPENVIGLSVLYLRVYFLGLPGALVYNFASALLRARGDTRRPMYYLSIAGIINVVLNLIFVICFRWDVAGVAAATAISKYVSAILVVWCLMQETGSMHLDPAQLKIDWAVMKEIARVGLPAGLQSSLFSLSNVTVQASVNSMGDIVMAGTGAAANIGGFIYTIGNAFYQASMTFTSQNCGAGKVERVDQVHRWCLLFGVASTLTAGMLAWVFRVQLLGLYSGDPAVIQEGITRIMLVNSMYFLSAFMEVNSGMLRGLGYSLMPMLVTLVGTCGLRIGWVATVFQMYRTPQSLHICYPISWGMTGLVHLLCFVFVRHRAYAKMGQKEPPKA